MTGAKTDRPKGYFAGVGYAVFLELQVPWGEWQDELDK